MYETVRVERDDGIAHVILDRPEKLNAVDSELSREFSEVFYALSRDDETRAIVLSGNGDSFCSGADLSEDTAHRYETIGEYVDRPSTFDAIAACPQPVVSAVHGWAVGIGFHFPLWSDLIYAAESAKFQLPQVSLGIMPAYAGVVQLYRFVGKGQAAEAALLGEPIDAEKAHRLGLVQQLLPDRDALMEYTMERARELAEQPPMSLRLAKESLETGMDTPLAHAGTADRYRFYALSETRESEEIHETERDRHS